jgi:hypothetical protein
MRKPTVSRRKFLAGASGGGAALALGLVNGGAAAAGPAPQSAAAPDPELLEELAQYANLPLSPARAAELAPVLASPLAIVRRLQPDDYDSLEPAVAFRVPVGG